MIRTRNAAWLTALCALAGLLLAASMLPLSSDLESRTTLALAPVTMAIHRAVQPAADVVLHASELRALIAENNGLRDSVARLEGESAALRDQLNSEGQSRAL